jgi:integrase
VVARVISLPYNRRMAVYRRKYPSGKTTWSFIFDAPGSTKANRRQIKASPFATKKEAQDAEAKRRIEAQLDYEAELRGAVAPVPTTLRGLIEDFCKEHGDKNLAAKTVERYRDAAAYIDTGLLSMPITEITPLHLTREWNRLRENGGHHRKTKASRPLSGKTVRNIAGVVSSAFGRGIRWGLVTTNPVTHSDLPTAQRKEGIALTPSQQTLLLEAAEAHWALPIILHLCAATGARRGEIMALRWADIQNGRAVVSRSLTQTRSTLGFKVPKNGRARVVALPDSALKSLEDHRSKQAMYREQFGPDYRSDLDLIVANPDGTPLRPDSISGTVSALFRRLKLPKGASLHSLRHTHGSHLLAAGMELPAVSARLGHSSTYVTATVYAHALSGRDDEAARIWEKFQNQRSESGKDRLTQ